MTRMWMIEPSCLCNQHLLGEHIKAHMINGMLKKKMNISGYIKNDCIEPESIISRHKQLSDEMLKRKMNHKSLLNRSYSISYLPKAEQKYKVNQDHSLWELMQRCPNCKKRITDYLFNKYKKLICDRAQRWSNSTMSKNNVCLSCSDLISIGHEVFLSCINEWDWKRSCFGTFLYISLNSEYNNLRKTHLEIKTKNIDDCFFITCGNNTEKQLLLKQRLEALSNNSKTMINSVMETPINLIDHAKRETGKAVISRKRLQRYFTTQKNWRVVDCLNSFKEIKQVLNY